MRTLIIVLAAGGAVMLVGALGGVLAPHDSTDPAGGRSGLVLYTDAGSGCQYLSAPGYMGSAGGLAPRLDASGKPMCGK